MSLAINAHKKFPGNWIPDWLIKHRNELPRRFPEFYGTIARIIGMQGSAKISRATIAKRFGVTSDRTISTYLQYARDNGFIATRQTGRSHEYFLLYHPWMGEPDLLQDRLFELPKNASLAGSKKQVRSQSLNSSCKRDLSREHAAAQPGAKPEIITEQPIQPASVLPAKTHQAGQVAKIAQRSRTSTPVSLKSPINATKPDLPCREGKNDTPGQFGSHVQPAKSQFSLEQISQFVEAERAEGKTVYSIPGLARFYWCHGVKDLAIAEFFTNKNQISAGAAQFSDQRITDLAAIHARELLDEKRREQAGEQAWQKLTIDDQNSRVSARLAELLADKKMSYFIRRMPEENQRLHAIDQIKRELAGQVISAGSL